ncbi:MAG TPA: phosphatase PAP2 family protein [Gemmatimonadaceae bacterium]
MAFRPSLFLPHAPRAIARTAAALLTAALINACATDQPAPTGLNASLDASRGLPFTEGLASPGWLQTAVHYVALGQFIPIRGGHAYPLLGVAQYLAVQKAEAAIGDPPVQSASTGNGIGAGGRPRLEADRGAVAGASAVVLSYLFPSTSQMQAFEDMVTAQENLTTPGPQRAAFLAGEAIGRAVGAEIVTRAIGDHFSDPTTAVIPPPGPSVWTSNTNPATINGGQLPRVLPWFLTSASQFRPGPPPAFGSTEFLNALHAIRDFSDHPTQEHSDIAAFWAFAAGTETAAGFWLERASEEIASHGLSERAATHLYALLSATMADAQIGCWDAKLHYWLIRPWQADPGIIPLASVGKPNHPSYPSGHSCVSSSAGEVLSTWFPERRAHFEAMVAEAGLSREVSGIHYHFDVVAGRDLGLNVAAFGMAADASGNSVLTAH